MTLYGKVEITDLNNTTYTLGSENRGYKVLLDKRKANSFTLHAADPQDDFKNKYVEGGEVVVYCDSSNPPTTKIFDGIIEDVARKDVLGTRTLLIQATEKFFVESLAVLVTERFSDKAAGWIAKTLIDNYTSGYTTTNVQNTDTTLESEMFNRDPLKKCLDRLAEAAGAVWYCTAAGDVYFHPKETVESGLALTESIIKPTPVIRKNIQDLYTSITVQGGVSLELDQSQENVTGGPVALYDRDIAVKFTPTKIYGKYIELYFDKLGSPDTDLSGHIADDSASNLPGEIRKFFIISRDQFTAAGWHGVKIEVELDISKSYWIVVNRGGDASNCYRWYHDGGTTGSHVEKTNGSWSLISNSWIPGYKQHGGNPVLARAVNSVTYATYGRRELIVKRPEVTHKKDAVKIASQILAEKGVVKTEFDSLDAKGEDLTSIPRTGELVNLTISQLNFDNKVVVEKVKLLFPAGSDTVQDVLFSVGEPVQDLSQRIAVTEEGLEEEKRKDLANQQRLDLIELFQESFSLNDALSSQEPGDAQHPVFTESLSISDVLTDPPTSQDAGTFVVGTAKVGFSDTA
ncbi:MAG: hypothetical protein ACE5KU_02975 [Nitrososphaerales archaeon]